MLNVKVMQQNNQYYSEVVGKKVRFFLLVQVTVRYLWWTTYRDLI